MNIIQCIGILHYFVLISSVTTYSLTDHSQSIASIQTTSTESQTGVSSASLYVSKSTTAFTRQSETTHTSSTSSTTIADGLKKGMHDKYLSFNSLYVYILSLRQQINQDSPHVICYYKYTDFRIFCYLLIHINPTWLSMYCIVCQLFSMYEMC